MSKLHELLAVENDVKGQFNTILTETLKTFHSDHAFKGFTRTLTMFDEKDSAMNTTERAELTTTVPKRLDYTGQFITRYLDVTLQKEATNQIAKADIIIDDKVIAADVPATFLLGLESKLNHIRQILERIPTLENSIAWEEAPDLGKGIWRQKYPEEVLKTAKQFKHQILVEPTEHHPAQIEKWEESVPVGRYVKTTISGMVTSNRKAQILENLDKLSRAVKKARQRANSTVVVKTNIGKSLLDVIFAEE